MTGDILKGREVITKSNYTSSKTHLHDAGLGSRRAVD
jgi:hypothetical protein